VNKKNTYQTIGPGAYAVWRAAPLGVLTETIEQRLILELMGELDGRRVLDAGCGDAALVRAAASRGARATGLDPDAAMLAAAPIRQPRRRRRRPGALRDALSSSRAALRATAR
jgi:2-polyprenyl-3-methyl-5-hydroxy-6-metoxy-1,4-benzoquinol methylase